LARRRGKAQTAHYLLGLFNLRGSDIDYNPVFFSFALITHDHITLFSQTSSLDSSIASYLSELKVQIKPYNDIYTSLQNLVASSKNDLKLMLSEQASLALADALGENNYTVATSPIALAKTIKNDVEIEGFRQCHIRDGAALVRALVLHWLGVQSY